jgi:hypothetical protein
VALLAAEILGAKAVLDLFGMVDLRADWYAGPKKHPPVIVGVPTTGFAEAQFDAVFAEDVQTEVPPVLLPGSRFAFVFWAFRDGALSLPTPLFLFPVNQVK